MRAQDDAANKARAMRGFSPISVTREGSRLRAAIQETNSAKGPSIEIFLAKIVSVRYIGFTSSIRYVDNWIALTPVKTFRNLAILLITVGVASAGAGPANVELQPSPAPADQNSHDIFSYETTYTFSSDFKESKLGHGDSLYDDFSYDHRFLITGKWYLRLGVEYERYDFDGTDNGLPDHLQAAYGHIAFEYVVKDFPGLGIEADPGVYFQNHVSGDTFDIPTRAFVSFPLKKDKIIAVVGVGWSLFQDPPVAPGGGIIWVFSDKLRLQAVFPKPALIYEPNDDWQLKLLGEFNYLGVRTDDVVSHTEHKLDLHNAVLQYSEYRAGVQVGYSGIKHLTLTAGAGCTVERDFDFFRAHQAKQTDPAPYIRIAAEARF